MKTLRDYVVSGGLYLRDTGIEAQVGDQVKLYLDTEADPSFPEFILGVVQHPITRVQCNSATSYIFEYNEADLEGSADLIRSGNVVEVIVVSAVEVLNDALIQEVADRIADVDAEEDRALAAESVLQGNIDAEEARALAAEALLAPKASPTFTGTVVLPTTTSIGTISSAEIGYLDGVTSSVQSQLNTLDTNKAPKASPTFTGNVVLPSTTTIGTVTAAEIAYLSGATSSIQVQLGTKAPSASPSFTGTVTLGDTVNVVLNATTGTKIGTATTQKLAFHNATPVAQRAGAAQAALVAITGGESPTEAEHNLVITLVNELRAALVEKGIIKGSA